MPPTLEKLKHADLAERFTKKGKLEKVEYWSEGKHHVVFQATSREHGVVALRVPKSPILKCPVNGDISAIEAVQQEFDMYSLLWKTAVFVPRPISVLKAKHGYSALVCELVTTDDECVTGSELGRVLRALHDQKVPFGLSKLMAVQKGKRDALDVLVRRIYRHYNDLLKEAPTAMLLFPRPDLLEETADKILARNLPPRLLHMDARNENLLQRVGITAGMIDWANAMVGPAVIEVYRVMEQLEFQSMAGMDAEFWAVYTEDPFPLAELSADEKLFLRMDVALERALRFTLNGVSPDLCHKAIRRVRDIAWERVNIANLVFGPREDSVDGSSERVMTRTPPGVEE